MPMFPPCMSQLLLGGPCRVVRRLSGPAVDGDKPHAGLDHAPREQQILPQRMHPITFAQLRRLAVQVERLPAFGARHRVVGLLAQVRPVLASCVLVQLVGLKAAEQTPCAGRRPPRRRGRKSPAA